jgi:arginine N-succinyltransferase
MLIIRPVQSADLEALTDLAGQAGGGLTTLPTSKQVLAQRIVQSGRSFGGEASGPGEAVYFLVLEETEKRQLVGTSAIYPQVGIRDPFYSYKILRLTQVSHDPEVRVECTLLTLVNDYAGCSELGTLYLRPDHRKAGIGRMLSKSRYLLIGAQPTLFAETVVAELRGWVDKDGESPFWDAVGRHFFRMSFAEADKINGRGNSQFIADMMPKFPIYTNLLPAPAQEVIGKPHVNTAAAMRILESEGFKYRGAVDIFDAGPVLEARRDHIKSVQAYREATLRGLEKCEDCPELLVANIDMKNFRAASTSARLATDGESLAMPADMAAALRLEVGAKVGYLDPNGVAP